MERLAAGPRRAGMFAGGNRHCHLAGGALRRPGLRLDESFSAAGGFVAVLVVVVLVVAVIGRLLRGVFRFAGFGLVDTLLGVVVAVLKYLLVLSALFAAFDRINADYTLVEARTIDQSRSYKPVLRLSEAVFPFLEWVGDRVPELDEKSEDDGA